MARRRLLGHPLDLRAAHESLGNAAISGRVLSRCALSRSVVGSEVLDAERAAGAPN
jgi:hypothetical protein